MTLTHALFMVFFFQLGLAIVVTLFGEIVYLTAIYWACLIPFCVAICCRESASVRMCCHIANIVMTVLWFVGFVLLFFNFADFGICALLFSIFFLNILFSTITWAGFKEKRE